MRHQLEKRAAEGVAVARGEVREGHLVGTVLAAMLTAPLDAL
jgi:hypothetical protein